MENFPGERPSPPRQTAEDSARNWLIGSLACSTFGGWFLGNTISMIQAGYGMESQIQPLVGEGLLIISSFFCFDKFLQKRQEIRQNR